MERSYVNLATVDKIRKDIEKTKEKISDLQKKLRGLEAQLVEEENLEIVHMVKAVKMDNKELTAFLKAYASGLITLPEDMMAADSGADDAADERRQHRCGKHHDHDEDGHHHDAQNGQLVGKVHFGSFLFAHVFSPCFKGFKWGQGATLLGYFAPVHASAMAKP